MGQKKDEMINVRRSGNETSAKQVMTEETLKKVVILTDSNGRDATEERVKCHMPREEREKVKVDIVVAYTLPEVCQKLRRGEIEVRGSMVVLDIATNDVRGTRASPQTSPTMVAERAGTAIDLLVEKGCTGVVLCEVKPIHFMDVTPYNNALNLKSLEKGTYGCKNQIRDEDLGSDGFHVKQSCLSVLEKTYACAALGVRVPCPSPPGLGWHLRRQRRYEAEWPRVRRTAREMENVWDARKKRRNEEPLNNFHW